MNFLSAITYISIVLNMMFFGGLLNHAWSGSASVTTASTIFLVMTVVGLCAVALHNHLMAGKIQRLEYENANLTSSRRFLVQRAERYEKANTELTFKYSQSQGRVLALRNLLQDNHVNPNPNPNTTQPAADRSPKAGGAQAPERGQGIADVDPAPRSSVQGGRLQLVGTPAERQQEGRSEGDDHPSAA